MKREFLKGFNLDDDTINKIMAKNGEDIEAEKKKVTALETEIETLKTDKKSLEEKVITLNDKNADSEDWKKKFEDLQKETKEAKDAEEAKQADLELTKAIEAVFGDAKFTSDYVRAGLISDMKSEISKPENKGKGYSEIYEALTKDKEGIFANPNPPGDMRGMGTVGDITDDKIREVMGLPVK